MYLDKHGPAVGLFAHPSRCTKSRIARVLGKRCNKRPLRVVPGQLRLYDDHEKQGKPALSLTYDIGIFTLVAFDYCHGD